MTCQKFVVVVIDVAYNCVLNCTVAWDGSLPLAEAFLS